MSLDSFFYEKNFDESMRMLFPKAAVVCQGKFSIYWIRKTNEVIVKTIAVFFQGTFEAFLHSG